MKRFQKGYTVIETLIAVAVSAIGFAAVFSMQLSTIQGNVSAKDFSAAINLAERYAEILRQSSHNWTVRDAPPAPFLSRSDGTWHTFSDEPLDHNDLILDADTGSDLRRQRFCVHYWLSPIAAAPYQGLMNGRVRVMWSWDPQDRATLEGVCAEANANGFDGRPSANNVIRSVTLPITLRFHQPGT
ncbi:MAG: prepilin-type N-terminal cleavage/methylation domain-containing protein [Bradymonadia bacterium]